jgi:hypothetical protein
MTVGELQDRMSDVEFSWWQALYLREADEREEAS